MSLYFIDIDKFGTIYVCDGQGNEIRAVFDRDQVPTNYSFWGE
jgi:hypothetical protein